MMANQKISTLPAATTPLAGTEVLPLVQGGVTVKVATDNLTVKNFRSNATSGILQMAGVGVGATRTMTTPDANFTVARTDAAQTFTGNQSFSNNIDMLTGDVIVGTAGKGIDFSANTHAAGMTSEVLDWYEEGNWTPSLAGNATYSSRSGRYTRIGNVVHIQGSLQVNVLGTGSTNSISGLPFSAAQRGGGGVTYFASLSQAVVFLSPVAEGGVVTFEGLTAASSTAIDGISIFGNGAYIVFSATYFV